MTSSLSCLTPASWRVKAGARSRRSTCSRCSGPTCGQGRRAKHAGSTGKSRQAGGQAGRRVAGVAASWRQGPGHRLRRHGGAVPKARTRSRPAHLRLCLFWRRCSREDAACQLQRLRHPDLCIAGPTLQRRQVGRRLQARPHQLRRRRRRLQQRGAARGQQQRRGAGEGYEEDPQVLAEPLGLARQLQ